MMMNSCCFKPYFKRPKCIAVRADKNIVKRDDLYVYNFIFLLVNRLNRISFHSSSYIKKHENDTNRGYLL